MTLTKADMTETIIARIGIARTDAQEIVDIVFEEMRTCLAAGEIVKLSGFGNFELRDKGKRPGRNPKTGEEIPITARRVVSFKAGQKLKSRVAQSKPRS